MAQGSAKSRPQRPKVVKVNVRLYEEDVRELKARSVTEVRFWHSILREVVHDALKRKRKVL